MYLSFTDWMYCCAVLCHRSACPPPKGLPVLPAGLGAKETAGASAGRMRERAEERLNDLVGNGRRMAKQ